MDRIEAFLANESLISDFKARRAEKAKYKPTKDASKLEKSLYAQHKSNAKFFKKDPMTFDQWRADEAAKREAQAQHAKEHTPAFMKQSLGIDATPLKPDARPTSEDQLIKMIRADASKWLMSIKSSQKYKSWVSTILDAWKNGEPADGPYAMLFDESLHNPNWRPTASFINSLLNIAEGVNGWEESMEICDGSQEFRVEACWINEFIVDALKLRYGGLLRNVDFGDGDEGHVYYEINLD